MANVRHLIGTSVMVKYLPRVKIKTVDDLIFLGRNNIKRLAEYRVLDDQDDKLGLGELYKIAIYALEKPLIPSLRTTFDYQSGQKVKIVIKGNLGFYIDSSITKVFANRVIVKSVICESEREFTVTDPHLLPQNDFEFLRRDQSFFMTCFAPFYCE